MTKVYKMYAWDWSHFAAKLRGYLNFKGIPYQQKNLNLYDLVVTVPRNTGAIAMPTVKTPEGNWLADTPLIIEALEERYPEPSINVPSPRQKICSMLIENWFDDGWMAVSGHTRWAYSENWDSMLKRESAKKLIPFAPFFISGVVAEKVFKEPMNRGMHAIGARPDGQDLQIEQWALKILDTLELHFQSHDFLFGGRPTVADFAVLASLAAHLNRDPWPKREWMGTRPTLTAWTERTHAGEHGNGQLIENDEIPATLQPLVKLMMAEFPQLIEETVREIKTLVLKNQLKSGDVLPRLTREVTYPMNGDAFRKNPFTYTVWRMQRIQRIYQSMRSTDQLAVDAWCSELGVSGFMQRDFGPTLERHGLGTRLG